MNYSNKMAARIFGISFLIGYLSYGIGFGMLNYMTPTINSLTQVFQSQNTVIVEAALLMGLLAPVNIVLGIIMTPIFKKYNQSLAYGYLGAAIASTLLLIVGAVFLLLLLPISDAFVNDATDKEVIELLVNICKKANFYCYQIAMFVWGLGGLIFAYLLYVSKLIPKWLSVYGIVSYVIFISGVFFALFGIEIDVLLDIPGGLFELFLSVRLIVKGFDSIEK